MPSDHDLLTHTATHVHDSAGLSFAAEDIRLWTR